MSDRDQMTAAGAAYDPRYLEDVRDVHSARTISPPSTRICGSTEYGS